MIEAVIVHIVRDGKILLHYKKRGHGVGKWNGVGGKIEPGEDPQRCALREAREEMGTDITNLRMLGKIKFYNVNGEDWIVYIFRGDIIGEPKESEESRPQWFSIRDIPYNEMWEDDKYWLSLVINQIKFFATFWFDGEVMKRFRIEAWKG